MNPWIAFIDTFSGVGRQLKRGLHVPMYLGLWFVTVRNNIVLRNDGLLVPHILNGKAYGPGPAFQSGITAPVGFVGCD